MDKGHRISGILFILLSLSHVVVDFILVVKLGIYADNNVHGWYTFTACFFVFVAFIFVFVSVLIFEGFVLCSNNNWDDDELDTKMGSQGWASVLASLGMTVAAVWVGFDGNNDAFNIWVPLAIGFQASVFPGIAGAVDNLRSLSRNA